MQNDVYFTPTLRIPATVQDRRGRPYRSDYGLRDESAVCLDEQSSRHRLSGAEVEKRRCAQASIPVQSLQHIAIIAADGLYKRDVFRLPDPFAVGTLNGEQTKTTQVCKRTTQVEPPSTRQLHQALAEMPLQAQSLKCALTP
ncbi:hypothetical protein F4802DRAFT_600177 [Xylaria palmicola]|nr:hypothetical protein F4802DRAFT_600177 [Xylaria palmicola]